MEIEFLHIADAVESVNGKLYMLGGCWNQHRSATFPSNIRCGIALGLLTSAKELKTRTRHVVTLGVLPTEGGGLIHEVQLTVVFEPQLAAVSMLHRNLITLNAALLIPKAGTYQVRAAVNDLKKIVTFEAVPQLQE